VGKKEGVWKNTKNAIQQTTDLLLAKKKLEQPNTLTDYASVKK
jgi:hypothetical protein